MPIWLAVVLIACTATLVREIVTAVRPPHRAIELGDRRVWVARRAWRLRAIAALAIILAFAQREAYVSGWHPPLMGVITALLLSLALVLLALSWWVYRRFL